MRMVIYLSARLSLIVTFVERPIFWVWLDVRVYIYIHDENSPHNRREMRGEKSLSDIGIFAGFRYDVCNAFTLYTERVPRCRYSNGHISIKRTP